VTHEYPEKLMVKLYPVQPTVSW